METYSSIRPSSTKAADKGNSSLDLTSFVDNSPNTHHASDVRCISAKHKQLYDHFKVLRDEHYKTREGNIMESFAANVRHDAIHCSRMSLRHDSGNQELVDMELKIRHGIGHPKYQRKVRDALYEQLV